MNAAFPPFHRRGEPDGDFYALAFAEGTYVSPTGKTREDGFLVMYYSPSPEFTRLSFETCTRAGMMLSYSRGVDRHDTPEFALLKACYEYRLPPHGWRLYPLDIAQRHWNAGSGQHEAGYAAIRRSLSSILYYLRFAAWSAETQRVARLFYPAASITAPDPFDETVENEEIFRSAFDSDEP